MSLLGHFTGTNSILLRPSYAYHLIFFEEGPCPNNGRYKHFSPHQSRASLNYQSDSRTPYSPVIQQTRLHDSSAPRPNLKAQPEVRSLPFMACRPANKLAFKTWHEDVLFWKDLLCIQTNFLTTLATFVSSFPTAKT